MGGLPLDGARILVPPARPEVNPLARMLREQGASTLYFTRLQPRHPASWSSMGEALGHAGGFDGIVFSGGNSVHHWMERARALRARAVSLGMSRSTEFSPDIGRCEELARQIEQLVMDPTRDGGG